MSKVEWNDSEPGFPDFLPPKPAPAVLTASEVERRIKGVLEAAGIACYITGRVTAEFPDGARCTYKPVEISADGLSHLRG